MADTIIPPEILDFSRAEPPPTGLGETVRRKQVALGSVNNDSEAIHTVGQKLSDDQVAALRQTYVSTGGNVSHTARSHEVDPRVVTKLAERFDWPVYAVESSESNRRQRQVVLFNKLETQLEEMLSSLEVETKDELDLATMSKRELSRYLEPLASRHSAYKTVFDSWMRLGAILYPEQFAKDPDLTGVGDASQKRDLALLGGLAGLHRSMEEIIDRVFIAGVPDRGITVEAEVLSLERGS